VPAVGLRIPKFYSSPTACSDGCEFPVTSGFAHCVLEQSRNRRVSAGVGSCRLGGVPCRLVARRGNDLGDRRSPRPLPGCQLRGELGMADDVEPELRPEQGQLLPLRRAMNGTGLEELEKGSGRGRFPLRCLGQGADLGIEIRIDDGRNGFSLLAKFEEEAPREALLTCRPLARVTSGAQVVRPAWVSLGRARGRSPRSERGDGSGGCRDRLLGPPAPA
jgi:hypothetical protein